MECETRSYPRVELSMFSELDTGSGYWMGCDSWVEVKRRLQCLPFFPGGLLQSIFLLPSVHPDYEFLHEYEFLLLKSLVIRK